MNTDLRQKFLSLPQPIINWLTSDSSTNAIIKINERLGLEGDMLKIIPSLISKLVIQGLKPEEFTKEIIQKLNLDPNQGEIISREIYLGILKPVEVSLKDALDINLGAIFARKTEEPKSASTAVPTRPIYPVYTPIKPASPLPPTPSIQPPQKLTPSAPMPPKTPAITETSIEVLRQAQDKEEIKSFDLTQDKPFMLHEESPTVPVRPAPANTPNPVPQSIEAKSLKPSFSYAPPKPPSFAPISGASAGDKSLADKSEGRPAPRIPVRPKPPQVKIEGVKTKNYPKKTKANEIRLVHYSKFKTML